MTVPSAEEIMKLVRIQLGIRTVTVHDRFVEDLGAESVDLLNLVALTEDTYRIELEEEKIANISSVRDFYELIRLTLEAS